MKRRNELNMKPAAVIHMLSPRNFKIGSYTRSPHVGGLATVSRHPIYIYIYIDTRTQTMRASITIYMHAVYIPAYIHNYVRKYLRTYIHIYTHRTKYTFSMYLCPSCILLNYSVSLSLNPVSAQAANTHKGPLTLMSKPRRG